MVFKLFFYINLFFLDDNLLATLPKAPRGNTAFLAVSLIVLFAIVAFGIVILIAKRRVSQSPQDEDLEYHRLMTK